ncbi:MAG TPA: hypothetical protein VGN23_13410 [Verrucomicrobiae bacterium]|jgi:ABC-type transport system involved in cytochrome bd biosynthesis fused ATPase/permease subunit
MDDSLPSMGRLDAGWMGIFALLGAILLVVIGLFIWATFIRKAKRRKRKYHEPQGNYRERLEDNASGIKTYLEKRRKRRRHKHRHHSPTLSETGGLPPRRPEEGETPSL